MEIENSSVQKNIDKLLEKEKIARQSNNHIELVNIISELTNFVYQNCSLEQFKETILSLSKKRGQAKKALIELVKISMNFVHSISDIEKKLELVETVKQICDKKIFLEVEYARCVLLIVKHQENENNIYDAAKTLQEVQVETYGSMDRREKIEFILYQMKIMLKKKDYVRLAIISRKLTNKSFEQQELVDLKVIYYYYLVLLSLEENDAQSYYTAQEQILDAVFKSQSIVLDNQLNFNFCVEKEKVLINCLLGLFICEYNSEKLENLRKFKKNYQTELEKLPILLQLLNEFLTQEKININLFVNIEGQQDNFQQQLRRQIIHHNLRIFSLYYQQITLQRISQILQISQEEVETELCSLINSKETIAKIDRVSGIITFGEVETENSLITKWTTHLDRIFEIIDNTCDLIKRENEISVQVFN